MIRRLVATLLLTAAFGADRAARSAPTLHAAEIEARVLVAAAAADRLVGDGQALGFAAAYTLSHPLRPAVVPHILAAGTVKWVHGSVSSTALAGLKAATDALATSVAG